MYLRVAAYMLLSGWLRSNTNCVRLRRLNIVKCKAYKEKEKKLDRRPKSLALFTSCLNLFSLDFFRLLSLVSVHVIDQSFVCVRILCANFDEGSEKGD